jgi:hypothetical protein
MGFLLMAGAGAGGYYAWKEGMLEGVIGGATGGPVVSAGACGVAGVDAPATWARGAAPHRAAGRAERARPRRRTPSPAQVGLAAKRDYGAVRKAIEDVLESNPDYDDGSYGPVLVRRTARPGTLAHSL